MSVTTAIPTGPVKEWCIAPQRSFFDEQGHQCANSSRGTVESDFQTFCCNGDIIDTSRDLYKDRTPNATMSLQNLVCCAYVHEMGGLAPLPTGYKQCNSGTPTPLASLAATNTKNAIPYVITFESAKQVGTSLTDWIYTTTPYCFWADTVHGVAMGTVTLPAPTFTTLPPSTDDDDLWGWNTASNGRASLFSSDWRSGQSRTTRSTSGTPTPASTSISQTAGLPTPTTPNAAVLSYNGQRVAVYLSLGLMAMRLIVG